GAAWGRGSLGSVVIAAENVSAVCHGDVTACRRKKPPAGVYRRAGVNDSRKEGLPGCRRPDRLAAGGDALQPVLDPGAELPRQRCVPQRSAASLALRLRPPDDFTERARLRRIVVLLAQ